MFIIVYADEALEQLTKLEIVSKKKIFRAIEVFKTLGKEARNSRDLGNGLWEIKADNVRAYFMYEQEKVIIIGLIALKKTRKAPKKFIDQAIKNIEKTRLLLTSKKE